jgi:hypothetical protein
MGNLRFMNNKLEKKNMELWLDLSSKIIITFGWKESNHKSVSQDSWSQGLSLKSGTTQRDTAVITSRQRPAVIDVDWVGNVLWGAEEDLRNM